MFNSIGNIQVGLDIATSLSIVVAIITFSIQNSREKKKILLSMERRALENSLENVKKRIDIIEENLRAKFVELSMKCSSDKDVDRIFGEIKFILQGLEEDFEKEFTYAFGYVSEDIEPMLVDGYKEILNTFETNMSEMRIQIWKCFSNYRKRRNENKEKYLGQLISILISRKQKKTQIEVERNIVIIPTPLYCLDQLLNSMQKLINEVSKV